MPSDPDKTTLSEDSDSEYKDAFPTQPTDGNSRQICEVFTGHLIDPVTFFISATERPEWVVQMEHALAQHVKLFPANVTFSDGDVVAYWSKTERVYKRARLEEPYRELCSGRRNKAYIFLIDVGVYVCNFLGVRDIVDVEVTCKEIKGNLPSACNPPLARKMSIQGLIPVRQEIEWGRNRARTTLRPTRNMQYTEAAVKFATRVLEIAEAAIITKDHELLILFPTSINYARHRTGLCGREELVKPGETVNYKRLLIAANFAKDMRNQNPKNDGRERYPHPKFTAEMFTRRRTEERNGADADVSGDDVICKEAKDSRELDTAQEIDWDQEFKKLEQDRVRPNKLQDGARRREENRRTRQGGELDEQMDERVRKWKLKKLEHDIQKKLKNFEDEEDAVEGATYRCRDDDEQAKLFREEKLEREKRDFKNDEYDQEALERALHKSRLEEEEADLERAIYRSLVQEESAIYGSLADLADDK